ncbi:major tail protein [Thomasclavelia ramosa]|uniref:major tail protein n=1 Tax=Thomasclavelia ramosa TaxID=1547 RepID=UPI00344CA952
MEGILRNLKGIRKLMVAPLTTDTEETLAYDTPVRFAGVKEVGGETEESTGTEYYDNQPAISTTAEGVDNYSVITSVLEDVVRAKIEGRKADEEKGIYFGTPLKRPYVAIGFISEDTNGQEWYNWIYKGKLTGGKEKHITKDDGTETTNLEWEYSSIYTQHRFKKADNEPQKFIRLKAGGDVTEEQFFSKVYDPDAVETMSLKAGGSK